MSEARTPPSWQSETKRAAQRKRRALSRYTVKPDGRWVKSACICEWDRNEDGSLAEFASEDAVLAHEQENGERRQRGEYPGGGYVDVPKKHRALATNINQHTELEAERTRDLVDRKTDEQTEELKSEINKLKDQLQSVTASSTPMLRYHVDHAAIRTNLERGGLTASQLLLLHRAANLQPPLRRNANGVEVPEKVKYQLAQSLCSAAGSGEHVVEGAQTFDYYTVAAWTQYLHHQRPVSEWTPPVHASLVQPATCTERGRASPRKRARTGGAAGSPGESLLEKSMDELRAMLDQRGLESRGRSKKVLVNRLLAAPGEDARLSAVEPGPAATGETAPNSECPQQGPAAEAPPAPPGGSALLERSLLDNPVDGGTRNLKLTVSQSATCSTASGTTSPTASAGTGAHDAAAMQSMDGTGEPPPPAEDTEAPRPPKESAIDRRLRHTDAAEVHDEKGRFARWAPLTVEGLCGHPCSDGKLCNNNVGDCVVHGSRERAVMALEDNAATLVQRGVCGIPVAGGGNCQEPQGRCSIHTEEWCQQRELHAMAIEDERSCIVNRGLCSVVPRLGGEPCAYPKSRCPRHAEEKERCQSALDHDPQQQCWNHRAEGSRFCRKHADYPNFSVVVRTWAVKRQRNGVPLDEGDFMTFIRTEYPDASYQQPKVHDFQKFVASFLNLSDPGDVAAVVE